MTAWNRPLFLLLLISSLVAFGCDDDTPATDAGTDTGPADTGTGDADPGDADPGDTSVPTDSSVPTDTGTPDTGTPCPTDDDYYDTTGSAFCTGNDADLAAISRTDYGPDMDQDISGMAGDCGRACISDPDVQTCTQACLVDETDASAECSDCFAGTVACAFDLCIAVCADPSMATECDACRVGTNECSFDCLAGFYTCTGIPAP